MGQIISWDFTSGNNPNINLPGGTTSLSFNTGGTTGISGCTGNGYSSNGWNVGEYLQIVAPTNGYEITTIAFNVRSSGTGPGNFKVQYSSTGTAGTFIDLPSGTFTSGNAVCVSRSFDFSAINALDNNSNTVIRFVFTGGEADGTPATGDAASTGTFRIDDLFINGPCSGTPNPGNTLASITSLTVGATTNLSLQNTTTNTGVTYQWYSSTTSSSGAWTSILGATSATYTATPSAANTWYYCDVTCLGSTGSSTPIQVTANYCAPTNTGTGTYINSFSTTNGETNIANNLTGYSSSGYNNYSNLYVSQYSGFSINYSLNLVGGTAGIRIWVDWNSNLIFEASELMYNSNGYISTGTTLGSFTVPVGTAVGNYRMRVMVDYSSSIPSACGFASTRGEIEDYTFKVVTLCSGASSGGTAYTTLVSSCSGFNSTLSVSGSPTGLADLTYQWQRSFDNGTNWADISGATSDTYMATTTQNTLYRRQTTCTSSGSSSLSTSVALTVNECPYSTTSSTYAATSFDLKACNAWNSSTTIPISISGLPNSGLNSCGTVLREVRVKLGNPSCKKSLSTYRLELKNPQGLTIPLAGISGVNGLTTTSTVLWADIKFRDHPALERINEYPASFVQAIYFPYSIGYYAIQNDGDFNSFNNANNPNGNWELIVYEGDASNGISIEKFELVFGTVINSADYTSNTNNNSCSNASCISNGINVGANIGYSQSDPQYPGEPVSGCSWNGGNNNSAWFKFVPTSTSARITISGMLNSTSPGANDMQPIVLKANGNCLTPNFVPTGGCPDDESINNEAYLMSNGGGISTPGNVYTSGISINCEFNLSDLAVNDIYYLYIDGNGGSSSSFYIEVENGVSNSCVPCPNIVVSGNTSICAGSAPITYSQTGSTATCPGTWSVSPASAGTINSTTGVFTPVASTSSPINAIITYNAGSCSGTLNVTVETCSFSECNIVVYKVGDGNALASVATPVVIEELNSTGNLIQTLTGSFTGDNLLTQSGSALSVGMLNSYNGLLSVPGYAVSNGANLSTSSPQPPLMNKVNSIFDKDKALQSYKLFPTSGTMPFSQDHLRSVIPISNNNFYCAGNSSGTPATGGIWYYDGASFIPICSTPDNVRNIEIYNGQLYLSTGTTTTTAPLNGPGIYQVGSGLPTTAGQTITPIITYSGGSPYNFSISPDGCTAYVADDGSIDNGGGIQKWIKSGITWSRDYTFGSPSRGLTVDYSGSNPVIYATTTAASNNSIIKITDAGSSSSSSIIGTAGSNYAFRGIDFTPNSYNSINISQQPSSFTICEGSSSQQLSVTANSSSGSLSYQWYSNDGNDYCGATAISGATSSTYTPPVNSIGTVYYFVKITNNCASIKNSNIVAVTVNQAATVVASVSNLNPCAGATINLNGSVGGSATSAAWAIKSGGGTLNTSTNPPTLTVPSNAGTVTLSYSSNDPDGAGPCPVVTTDVEITVANCISCPSFWANTQYPASGEICSDNSFNAYGQVYIPSVTEGVGQGASVTAQLGYSTTNSDPSTWTNWVNATHNPSVNGNNDEYMATLSGLTGNTYYYAFRYSYNTCPFIYGGYSPSSANTWTVNAGGGGAFVGSSSNNGGGSSGINSSNGLAFGLYNSSGGTTEAIRNFSAITVGQTIQFDMDNGWVENGKSVGVGLQNAIGQNVWEIYFSGGGSSYVINTGSTSLPVNIPYTTGGLRINFTLTSSSTYSATVQILNGGATYGPYTGNLINPSGGVGITRFRAFNFSAGNGSNYHFFVNNIYTPTFSDNATGYSSGNLVTGSQSSTAVGGIWNNSNPNTNGRLTVTEVPTTSNTGTDQTICEGNSYTLVANQPEVGKGVWSITSGPNTNVNQLSSTTANNAVFTPTEAGIYELRWTITNDICTSFSEVTITVTSGVLDFVNIQFPGTAAICSGETINVYGQVFEPGVTLGAGQGENIEVQVGFHSENTNPNSWPTNNWSSATFNSSLSGNNDEYIGTFGSTLSPGTFYYAFRYRLNGCNWQYGGYSIGGGGTWNGTNNISGILTVYNNPGTAGLSMTPSNICEGVQNIEISANNAGSYELFVEGVSQGAPSATKNWTIAGPLNAGDEVCVRGYAANNLIKMDGVYDEPFWNPPLVNSAGGAISSTQNRINALYVKNAHGFLNIGIAGKLVYSEDRKIMLFIDSKSLGYNSLTNWNMRSNAPHNGMKNLKGDLNGTIQFDPGFSPDYIVSIGTNTSGVSFLDFYDMQNNTNNYLGSTATQPSIISYQENTSTNDFTKGYEIRIPINLFGVITSPMKIFTLITNNPADNSSTTLSNQFLSPAVNGEGDYGSGSVNFGNAAPNPVSYVLESDCYDEECKTVLAKPLIVAESSVCINEQINLSPNIGGIWSSGNDNIATITNSGVVTGISGGKTTFTFTSDNSCSSSTNPIDIIEIKTSTIKFE